MTELRSGAMAVLAGLTAVAFAASAQAQAAPDLERQRAEMAKLAGLAGAWRGSGWIAMGPGEPKTFSQTERVAFRSDGLLLVIEGEGRDADGAIVHDAFGVVSFDEASGAYQIRAYANGRAGTYPMTWLENGDLRWTIAAGGREVRYTITLDADTWTEVGAFQTPDSISQTFLEFRLARVDAEE